MSNRSAARSTTLRDQIVTALRSAYPAALTTVQLAQQLPPVVVRTNSDFVVVGCAYEPPDERYRVLECHDTWHLVRRPCRARDIHRHLLALARVDQIVRVGHNRSAAASESWTVEPDACALQELVALEQLWAHS